ncbi:TonB-dependent receptor [Pelagerythrobacter marinus]|uniref:TonB-dependent receptor n=1 Tax=Pelagerythrobacter marinus TaxID=538382 RepID=UPI0020375AD4|nr:TonB-dependent receptor [Pelagerythrobacter marinus]USA38702.1 TonB-dependent receptor [Pelagerythrobacter marinus]WPZ07271.1 TonB-dependent receptor [Pelagerythrobacter marinus]
MNIRYASARAIFLSTALAAVPAMAEEAGGQAGSDGAAQAGNQIVVTAQKIEQRAQDVPITISALRGDRIEELGVGDLDELSNYIPGLNVQEQSANNPGIVIRGVTSDSGSAQQGPRVTLYYNGVDISRSRGSYQSIYDLDRVEVIKGPQATLFGTASAVGAISIVPARPEPGLSAELTGGYGNYDYTLLTGYLNAGSDQVAGRIAFEWKRRDGYVENLSASQEDELYALDNLGLRGSLRVRPGPDFTIDLVGTFDRQRNGGTPFISGNFPTEAGPADPFGPANLGGSPFSREVLGKDQLGLDREIYDLNLTAEYRFADDWAFTTVNGYREFDSLETFDADGSAAWFLEFAEIAEGWQFSHEGRFSYSGMDLRGSFGWNVFTEDGRQNVPFSSEEGIFLQCAAGVVPDIACVAPDGSVPAEQVTGLLTGGQVAQLPYQSVFENQGQNDSYSVFADATWIATRALELTAGVRLLWEDRQSGYFAEVAPSVLTGGPSLIPGQTDTNGRTFTAREDFFDVLPRFNALYRASPDLNFYATVSKGRRSAVVQLGATRDENGIAVPNYQLVPEEVVWNYELGAKLSRGPVSASLGAYYLDYSGFQVSVIQDDGTTRTESAGSASNLGIEAELAVQAAPWLSLFANGAYIDAKVDEDSALADAYSGARFRLQPKWQAAAGFTIDAPIGEGARFFATPSVTHRSRIYFELPNNPVTSQGSVTLLNARAGIAFARDRFEIAGFIRNATNEDYLLDAGNTGGAFGYPTFIPAEPRFYGIELTARLF